MNTDLAATIGHLPDGGGALPDDAGESPFFRTHPRDISRDGRASARRTRPVRTAHPPGRGAGGRRRQGLSQRRVKRVVRHEGHRPQAHPGGADSDGGT